MVAADGGGTVLTHHMLSPSDILRCFLITLTSWLPYATQVVDAPANHLEASNDVRNAAYNGNAAPGQSAS